MGMGAAISTLKAMTKEDQHGPDLVNFPPETHGL